MGPFRGVTSMVYVAAVVWVALPVAVSDERVKVACAVPVPFSETVCGELPALSATERVAAKVAADSGVNVTEIVHEAPAATDEPQVLVWEKSPGFAPPMAMLVMESVALLVLESVAVWAVLELPMKMLPKLNDAGVSTAAGAGTAVPVPLSATVCGEPLALSVTVRAAL